MTMPTLEDMQEAKASEENKKKGHQNQYVRLQIAKRLKQNSLDPWRKRISREIHSLSYNSL